MCSQPTLHNSALRHFRWASCPCSRTVATCSLACSGPLFVVPSSGPAPGQLGASLRSFAGQPGPLSVAAQAVSVPSFGFQGFPAPGAAPAAPSPAVDEQAVQRLVELSLQVRRCRPSAPLAPTCWKQQLLPLPS